MPHSSGGGFHGGGFHTGGGFHSGGHSGHNLNIVTHRISKTHYAGAHAYIFYHHHFPHVVYSSESPLEKDLTKSWIHTIILFLVCLIPFGIIFGTGLHFPKKLNTNYDTRIIIEDDAGYLTDDQETLLKNTFLTFYDKTGITPSFAAPGGFTMMFWPSSLEDYAYADYLTKFKDEKHWLIVYRGGENYHFECIQGNDTDHILNLKVRQDFYKYLNDHLEDGEHIYTALTGAFDFIMPTVMNPCFCPESDAIAPAVLIGLVAIPALGFAIYQLVASYRFKDAVKYPDGSILKHCPYCSNPYYTKTVKKCPKCGAILEDDTPQVKPKTKEKDSIQEDEYAIDPKQFEIDKDNF